MKKTNNSAALNTNETEFLTEHHYRVLRQKFGVELSGLQQGFYHVLYGNKLMNRNLHLNYNPQYGIYTGFSLLLLLFFLVIVVTYYKIKQKTRAFLRKSLQKIQTLQKTNPIADRKPLTPSIEIVQMIGGSTANTDLQFIRTLSESDSTLESIQKLKTSDYHLTPFVENFNQYSIVAAHNVRHSWNNLSPSNYNSAIPSENCVRSKDFDSLSMRTAVEFPNPVVFSLNATSN